MLFLTSCAQTNILISSMIFLDANNRAVPKSQMTESPMTEPHGQTDWPCLTITTEAKSLVPMIQRDIQQEIAHGYAAINVSPEHRDHSRLPPSSYVYGPPLHPPFGGYLTQPHGVPKVISDPKLQPSTAPVLPNACQNVFFQNPLYQHETAHGYAANVPFEYRDHSRLPPLRYMYDQPSHPPASGHLTQPHGMLKVILDSKLLPSTAPVLPNARQNVFLPNPPYPHETPHGYATNVPPEYRDHSRLPPSSYVYGKLPHPSASGYLTQPYGMPKAVLEPKLQPRNADVGMGGGPPSVGMDPVHQQQVGVERYAYQQPLWSLQPQQQLFTLGNPPYSYPKPPPTILTSTTPSQSTVHPHTDTHKYVTVSLASTITTVTADVTASNAATFNNNGSPAHSTLLQVPSKISHGYQSVSLSPVIPRQKQYSDNQLEKQIQALNLEATTEVAEVPPLPMSSHPLHYPTDTSSVPEFLAPMPQKDLKPIQLQGK